MATRRTHHKTRLGCTNCKQRRVKCDECKPICGLCTKKGWTCSLQALEPKRLGAVPVGSHSGRNTPKGGLSRALVATSSRTRLAALQTGTESATSSPPVLRSDSSRIPSPVPFSDWSDIALLPGAREQDLPSLWQFFNQTATTLSDVKPGQDVWKNVVPRLAFEHPIVTPLLISTGSLHMVRLYESNPTMKKHFMRIASYQMNQALPIYRREIGAITKENVNALAAFAMCIVRFVMTIETEECMALLRKTVKGEVSNEELSKKMAESIGRWLRATHGILILLKPGWHWINEGPMGPLFARGRTGLWPPLPEPTTPAATEDDNRLAALASTWQSPTELDFNLRPGEKRQLGYALRHLRFSFALCSALIVPNTSTDPKTNDGKSSLSDTAAAVTWPAWAREGYVRMVEKRIPSALIIAAHYGILTARFRGPWWLDGISEVLVAAAALSLPESQRHLIIWPMNELKIMTTSFTPECSPDKTGTEKYGAASNPVVKEYGDPFPGVPQPDSIQEIRQFILDTFLSSVANSRAVPRSYPRGHTLGALSFSPQPHSFYPDDDLWADLARRMERTHLQRFDGKGRDTDIADTPEEPTSPMTTLEQDGSEGDVEETLTLPPPEEEFNVQQSLWDEVELQDAIEASQRAPFDPFV